MVCVSHERCIYKWLSALSRRLAGPDSAFNSSLLTIAQRHPLDSQTKSTKMDNLAQIADYPNQKASMGPLWHQRFAKGHRKMALVCPQTQSPYQHLSVTWSPEQDQAVVD